MRLYEQAVEAFLKRTEVSQLGSKESSALKEAYATSGWKGFWLKSLNLQKEKAKQRYVAPYWSAEIYARLGEKDQAFVWLENACEDRHWMIAHLKVDPASDGLRSDPRFTEFSRRVGLAPWVRLTPSVLPVVRIVRGDLPGGSLRRIAGEHRGADADGGGAERGGDDLRGFEAGLEGTASGLFDYGVKNQIARFQPPPNTMRSGLSRLMTAATAVPI